MRLRWTLKVTNWLGNRPGIPCESADGSSTQESPWSELELWEESAEVVSGERGDTNLALPRQPSSARSSIRRSAKMGSKRRLIFVSSPSVCDRFNLLAMNSHSHNFEILSRIFKIISYIAVLSPFVKPWRLGFWVLTIQSRK